MLPEPWAGAGSAPWNNIVGVDPQLRSPEDGDYRPAAGSPATDYGCQTFLPRKGLKGPQCGRGREVLPPARPLASGSEAERPSCVPPGGVIDAAGVVDVDTAWETETVRVVGDVIVPDGVTLTIRPGVQVVFQDYYRLKVAGTLRAVGLPECRIVFTSAAPPDFMIDLSHTGCWNGIRFEGTSAVNAPSRLEYCIIEYSKAAGGDGRYGHGGGALSVTGFADLTVENCILRGNLADYGGAVFLYRQANVRLAGNLIVGNHALVNAAAVYCAYSYPVIINNAIVGNRIHNATNPYIDAAGVLCFIAKPVFTNNIVRDNDPFVSYLPAQVRSNKAYYTRFNNIEGGETIGGNIDADPRFVMPAYWADFGTPEWEDDTWVDGDHHLRPGSPGIDAGRSVAAGTALDLSGDPRFVDDPVTPDTGEAGSPGGPVVDIGPYEYQAVALPGDFDIDGDLDEQDYWYIHDGMGFCAGTQRYQQQHLADLDADGCITLVDYQIWLLRYHEANGRGFGR